MSPSENSPSANPYAAPASSFAAGGDCSLSETTLRPLLASRRWMLAAGYGVLALGAVEIVMAASMAVLYYRAFPVAGYLTMLLLPAVMLVAAAAVLWMPWLALRRSTLAVHRLQTGGSDDDLQTALREHGRFWRRLGIGVISLIAGSYALPLFVVAIYHPLR
jgi:hypothetical protein